MAIRTTAKLVKEVLMSDYGPDRNGDLPPLAPFIATANSMVNRLVVCAARRSVTVSDADLELVERWLAAHCYVMSDQPYEEETTGRAKAIYQGKGKLGMRLDASKYGMTAQMLDYTGCLASLSSQKVASVTWLGKPPSSQTDYVDRD